MAGIPKSGLPAVFYSFIFTRIDAVNSDGCQWVSMISIFRFRDTDRKRRDERTLGAFRACYGEDAPLPRIRRTDKGKPFFVSEDGRPVPYFSVTDSGDWWLIAFSKKQIGIDLQQCLVHGEKSLDQQAERCLKIAGRFFHPEEMKYLSGLSQDGPERVIRGFFRIWTASEAYLKLRGSGIDASFRSLNVMRPVPGVEFFYPDWDTSRGEYMLCVCSEKIAADGMEDKKQTDEIILYDMPAGGNIHGVQTDRI